MKLPNGERAIVSMEKLTGYCLKVDHAVGGHKAHLFRSMLGITTENANLLRSKLIEVAKSEEAMPRPPSPFGQGYEICFMMEGPNGNTAEVVSGWIIDNGSDTPRLVTCRIAL